MRHVDTRRAQWRTRAGWKAARRQARGLARGLGRSSGRAAVGALRGRRPNSPFPRACANGRSPRSAPGVCCLGSRSPSALASSFISPPSTNRLWWAACAFGGRCHGRSDRPAGRPVGFVLSLGFLAIAAGFAVATLKTALIDASGAALSGLQRLGRRASSSCARRARRPTALCCGSNSSTATASPGSRERVRLSVRRGMAPPAGAFIEVEGAAQSAAAAAAARQLRFCPRPLFPAHRRLGFHPRRHQDRYAACASRHAAARKCLHSGFARRHRCAHPLRARGRRRFDRLGADHRQARCDRAASLRRHVRVRHRPRALDLRLSHGGGRRRGVLHHPRAARADSRDWPIGRRSRNGRRSGR